MKVISRKSEPGKVVLSGRFGRRMGVVINIHRRMRIVIKQQLDGVISYYVSDDQTNQLFKCYNDNCNEYHSFTKPESNKSPDYSEKFFSCEKIFPSRVFRDSRALGPLLLSSAPTPQPPNNFLSSTIFLLAVALRNFLTSSFLQLSLYPFLPLRLLCATSVPSLH